MPILNLVTAADAKPPKLTDVQLKALRYIAKIAKRNPGTVPGVALNTLKALEKKGCVVVKWGVSTDRILMNPLSRQQGSREVETIGPDKIDITNVGRAALIVAALRSAAK